MSENDLISKTQCKQHREETRDRESNLKNDLRHEIDTFENNIKELLQNLEKDFQIKLDNKQSQLFNQIESNKRHLNQHIKQSDDRFKSINTRIDKYDDDFNGEQGIISRFVLMTSAIDNIKISSIKHDKFIHGTDKHNPGADTRISLMENNLKNLVKLQVWIIGMLIPTVVSIIIFIGSNLLK